MLLDSPFLFVFIAVVLMGLALSVSLLLLSTLSEDKDHSVFKQVWQTFFGSGDTPLPSRDDISQSSESREEGKK